jgi:hemerythrin-like domain-containing protein
MHALLETLQAQHASLRPLIDLVEVQAHEFAHAETPNLALFEDALRFVGDYPGDFHHPVERALLDLVARRGVGTRRLVADFAAEQRRLQAIGAELSALLEAARSGVMMPRAALHAYARVWVAGQRERLQLEDELLFPLADKYLSATDWARLARDHKLAGGPDAQRFTQRHDAIAQEAGCGCQPLAA